MKAAGVQIWTDRAGHMFSSTNTDGTGEGCRGSESGQIEPDTCSAALIQTGQVKAAGVQIWTDRAGHISAALIQTGQVKAAGVQIWTDRAGHMFSSTNTDGTGEGCRGSDLDRQSRTHVQQH